MKNRRGGLGRGLGALIPTGLTETTTVAGPAVATAPPEAAPAGDRPAGGSQDGGGQVGGGAAQSDLAPVPGARFREIPIRSITPNPKQPRQVFDEEPLEELKASIQQVGLLQPIVVRELSEGR